MKNTLAIIFILFVLTVFRGDSQEETGADTAAAGAPETLAERAGYAYGSVIGKQLMEKGIAVDAAQFARALADVYGGKEPVMSDREIQNTFAEASGAAFLKKNGEKEGVKTTASGLQYEVLKKGDGPKPTETDTVTVHYRGTLIDGAEFDSSYSRDEPTSFPLDGVIKGWTEGLQLMPVGSKFRFVIPYGLAYGKSGSPPKIPPFSTLIFEVELLSID